MLIPGLCSLTLKHLPPSEILSVATAAGLQAIEWWGGAHLPPGDLSAAKTLGNLTRRAGLRISSYGSYYRAGVSEKDGPSFARVLATAVALGAPTVRVWAGDKNFEETPPAQLAAILEDTARIAGLAAAEGLSVTFEFHGGTLTNSAANARHFAALMPHPGISFSWQPPHGFAAAQNLEGLDGLLDRLSTIHVYHWTLGAWEKNLFSEAERTPVWPDDFHRHPLADGFTEWSAYLARARTTGRDHCALLEFVRDNSVEQFQADAATLVQLCRD